MEKKPKCKRKSKTCRLCGCSVQNLSRHKKDVHGMSQINRKLDDYISGEKKNPKRLVKFCPLSPCKYKKSGLFQLHKHLQSGIHKLTPNTSGYLKALRHAKRVSIADVDAHLKKIRKKEKKKRRRNREKKENIKLEVGESRKRGMKKIVSPVKRKRKAPKKSIVSSDEEYDLRADQVWEKTQNKWETDANAKVARRRIESLFEEAEIKPTVKESKDDSDNNETSYHERPANIAVVELSDESSTDGSDADFVPIEDASCSSESTMSTIVTSTSMAEEKDELLTELVEVIGEKYCYGGSLLDADDPWKNEVKKFMRKSKEEGKTFRRPSEVEQDLVKIRESLDNAEEGYLYDDSDEDDALDNEWVPSENELLTEKSKNENDASSKELLTEFASWLVGVDGGYRKERIAQQYRSQVQSVIHKLRVHTTPEQATMSDVDLLTIDGHEGVVLLRKWLSAATEMYQPGTVRSYLMSMRLFFKFLMQEGKLKCFDILQSRRDVMTSWSAAQKKKVLKRKLEKRDEDYRKLLSGEKLHKVCHGDQRVNTIKQLGSASEQTNRGENVQLLISDRAHCEIRDWLITRLLIDNSGRSGVAANMTVAEFKDAVFYPSTDDDGERYRILVQDHKTAGIYGAAVVWAYTDLYKLIDIYIRTVRSQFTDTKLDIPQVFVSSNGLSLTSSQVSTSIWRTFQREGIEIKGRVSATTVRKSIATGVHLEMPEEQDRLAALAQHKPQTQANYYRVHDKVNETDLGRRAVERFVSTKANGNEKGFEEEKKITHVEWTVQELDCLKKVFHEQIISGDITNSLVRDKLGASNILQNHSLKAVVLRVQRLKEQQMESIDPPIEEEKSRDKVLRFLSSSSFEHQASAPSVTTTESKTWNRFTDEQVELLVSLNKDMVMSNTFKREIIWERVKEDQRAYEIGLISRCEDQEQEEKFKQRLADKLRKEARARHLKKKKYIKKTELN